MSTHPTEYAHREALVETDWLETHLKDDGIRVIESNENILLYDTGHIPDAVHIDGRADLQNPAIRGHTSPENLRGFAAATASRRTPLAFSTATREIPKYAETKHAVEDGEKQ
jgi:hypothetical protein